MFEFNTPELYIHVPYDDYRLYIYIYKIQFGILNVRDFIFGLYDINGLRTSVLKSSIIGKVW